MKEEEPDNPPELAKFAPLVTRPPKQKVKEVPLFSEPLISKKVPPPAPIPETVAFYHVSFLPQIIFIEYLLDIVGYFFVKQLLIWRALWKCAFSK
jgi:hypothetical protein